MNISDINLLVAEDHAFQRHALVAMLRALGARSVSEASDGSAALDLMRQPATEADVVICDLEMPEMDGMEFIRHLGESRSGVSVILTSAHDAALISAAESMSRAYGVEVLGAIGKPVTQDRLAALLARHRERPRHAGAAHAATADYTIAEIEAGIDHDEFEPFFQPKVAMRDGRVIGAEALARWRHPRDGILPPAAFLPHIESGGAIAPLTWAMLKTAARACRRWRDAGIDVPVAVNLSQSLLADRRLAERITALVRDQGLDPRHMVLEVTESAAMSDPGTGLENLARLRMKGFGLSIDDFGTGFSSMQQLSRIPFTELKIDRSFVSGADREEKLRAMIESSLMLAGKLKLDFVAEGVEHHAEWQTLRSLGCGAAQGYFISRPLDAAGFGKWLGSWQAPQ